MLKKKTEISIFTKTESHICLFTETEKPTNQWPKPQNQNSQYVLQIKKQKGLGFFSV